MKMGGDYEKEISDRKIYNPVCDWRNGIFFAGSFSTWIFTLFDVFMWWGMFTLLWASKRKCKDQDKFYQSDGIIFCDHHGIRTYYRFYCKCMA